MKGGSQTITNGLDPRSQRYVEEMRNRARSAAGAGTPAGMTDALDSWRGLMDLGGTGAAAMAGDPAAVSRFMNPFNSQMGPVFDEIRRRTMTSVDDAATQAGAWGGSRHGVATGQALADVGNNEAAMHYGEFSNAMNRAGLLAGLGLDAGGRMFQGAGDAAAYPVDMMNRGLGPTGSQQTVPMRRNLGAGFLGGAASGLGMAAQLGINPWAAFLGGGLLGSF